MSALEGERSTAGRATLRVRSALLVIQIGLSVVLLVAAGLVLRSFIALRQVNLGFTPDRVLSVTVQPGNTSRPPNEWLQENDPALQIGRPADNIGGAYIDRPARLRRLGSCWAGNWIRRRSSTGSLP